MGMYEKIQKTIGEWKDGEYILSRGYKMDCYPEKVYGIRDKVTISGDKFTYKLWDTEIVEYNKNTKKLGLYTGGWKTKMTKERMNTVLSLLKLPYSIEGRYETRRTSSGPWYLIGKDSKQEFNGSYLEISLQEKPFDQVGFIMKYEGGDITKGELIEGFQNLIDTGIVWNLQGSYGRTATALIEAGYCHN